jgi:hypothetical protein
MQKQNIIFIFLMICMSCNDRVRVGGVILDRETGKPVAKVYISQRDIAKNTVVPDLDSSDQNGRYDYKHALMGKYTDSVFVTLYFFWGGGTLTRNIRNGTLDDTVFLLLPHGK